MVYPNWCKARCCKSAACWSRPKVPGLKSVCPTQTHTLMVCVFDWGWQRRKSTIRAGPSCAAAGGRQSEQSTSLTALDVYSVLQTPLEHPHPPTPAAHIQSRQGSEWSEPQYRCRVTKETHLCRECKLPVTVAFKSLQFLVAFGRPLYELMNSAQ